MGIYINPTNRTKESFLAQHGVPLTQDAYSKYTFDGDHLPICLVDNGFFTAAAVAYNAEERDAFLPTVSDTRPRRYYLVALDVLNEDAGINPALLKKFMSR